MISKTKYIIDEATVKKLFEAAGIAGADDISPLGAGEYNAVFSAKAGGREYAVKVAPDAGAPILTYEKDMMASEVFWYKQMREHTSIRVPEIYFTDFSRKIIPTDYFIMEKLPGVQMDKLELNKEEKAEAAAVMARMAAEIHAVKNNAFGYIQNGLYPDWHSALKSMAGALLADCAKKGRKSKRGEKLMVLIDKYQEILKGAECCMVNFDIWPPNIMCIRQPEGIEYAWIDPERTFWGDRMADFVCLEMLSPLAGKTVSIKAYNAAADYKVTASHDECVRYALAQGYLALIMEVEKYFRYTPKNFGWWRNVIASAMLYKRSFKALDE